jgi:hypothetical protein
MAAGVLSRVPVHRCAADGAWFDRGGLERALRASADAGTADAARGRLADYRAPRVPRRGGGAPVCVIGLAAGIAAFAVLGIRLRVPLAVRGVRRFSGR